MNGAVPWSRAGRLVAAIVPLLVVDPPPLPPCPVVRPAAAQLRLDIGVLEHCHPGVGLRIHQPLLLLVVRISKVVVQATGQGSGGVTLALLVGGVEFNY